MTTFFHAIMTSDAEETVDMELVLTTGGLKGHHVGPYIEENYKKRTGPDLLELVKNGVL